MGLWNWWSKKKPPIKRRYYFAHSVDNDTYFAGVQIGEEHYVVRFKSGRFSQAQQVFVDHACDLHHKVSIQDAGEMVDGIGFIVAEANKKKLRGVR